MAADPKRREWTADEVRREERAQRARVRRDAARGVTTNLSDAVAHTEFAKRFAEAFKRARRA
jgi:pyruvate-formate lyase-activating enzyme